MKLTVSNKMYTVFAMWEAGVARMQPLGPSTEVTGDLEVDVVREASHHVRPHRTGQRRAAPGAATVLLEAVW